MLEPYNFILDPQLNFLTINEKKLKRFLAWLIYAFLVFCAIGGIYFLIIKSFKIFYISLFLDCFLFYLWQHRTEKIKKVSLPKKDEKIEIAQYFDKQVQKALERAWVFALSRRHTLLLPLHVFWAFLKDRDFDRTLKRLDCEPQRFKEKINNVLRLDVIEKDMLNLGPKISPDLERIFMSAYFLCLKQGNDQISSLDILWAMAEFAKDWRKNERQNLVQMIFDEFGISPEEIAQAAILTKLEKDIKKWSKFFFFRKIFKPSSNLNRAMTSAATPKLNQSINDLTAAAKQNEAQVIIDREKEIQEIITQWAGGQVGIVLVGQSGIGKKSVVQKLAQMMVEETTLPKFLQDKRLVKLELGGLKEKGEEYFKTILHEINRAGNIILFIEDVDNLAGLRSEESGLDFAEILGSALDSKAFFFIATATPQGFSSKIESGVLGRVLAPQKLKLPDKYLLLRILAAKVFEIEKETGLFFSVDAINQAIDLSDKFLYGQALPAKATDLIKEASSFILSKKQKTDLVRGNDLLELVSQKTEIPLAQVQEVEKEKLLNLEDLIHQRMINQESAVDAVANALRRARVNLRELKKPIANFLFVGPTGVGKTELARTLARVYFGDERRMIRLDMSEYQEKMSMRRMIGARTESGLQQGYLTEAVKRQPYSILLLDEIEKAHPEILNLFLQVMDDGRLTDASGETINFTNIILIATSNAGTKIIQDKIKSGQTYEQVNKELRDTVLMNSFSPEFLNRFDEIVLFKALTMENMLAITNIMLDQIKKKMEEKGILFEVESEAVKELAVAGYDPLFGARPLNRVIQDKVDDALARMFLENQLARRDQVILKKGLEFQIIKAPII